MANEKKIDHIEVGGVSYLVDDSQAVKKSDMMSLSEINEADESTNLANKVPSAKVIKEMQSNFQAGVDTVYNGCKTYGSTPTASTPSAIVTAIEKIYNDRYNAAKVGTATAAHVLTGSTFTSSKVDPGTQGSMKNLTASATITHDSGNGTKVILGDACYISKNSDNVDRLEIRYNSDPGYITGNTLFALPYNTVATTIGLTAEKIAKGQQILGITGTKDGVKEVSDLMRTGISKSYNGNATGWADISTEKLAKDWVDNIYTAGKNVYKNYYDNYETHYSEGKTAGYGNGKDEWQPTSVSVTDDGHVYVKNKDAVTKYDTTISNSYKAGYTAFAATLPDTLTLTGSGPCNIQIYLFRIYSSCTTGIMECGSTTGTRPIQGTITDCMNLVRAGQSVNTTQFNNEDWGGASEGGAGYYNGTSCDGTTLSLLYGWSAEGSGAARRRTSNATWTVVLTGKSVA